MVDSIICLKLHHPEGTRQKILLSHFIEILLEPLGWFGLNNISPFNPNDSTETQM